MSRNVRESLDFAAEPQTAQPGMLREFAYFLGHTKRWWLIPIILVLLLMGGLIVFGGSAAAPLIYTLF